MYSRSNSNNILTMGAHISVSINESVWANLDKKVQNIKSNTDYNIAPIKNE